MQSSAHIYMGNKKEHDSHDPPENLGKEWCDEVIFGFISSFARWQ